MKNKLKKYNNGGRFGEFLMNQGRSLIDTPLSMLGMGNVIPDEAYKGAGSKFFKGYSNVLGGVGKAALPMAGTLVGIPPQITMAAQQGLGSLNPQQEEQMQYAQGGIHQGMPNAELEQEEVMRMPNGATAQVDGPSHEMGGVPVNIPNGTQIYSDKLRMPGTKLTFAKLAEKYKVNKEQKVLDDEKANSLSKSTAKLAMDLKQRKLSEIFNAQETLKQAKLDKYASKLGLSNEFKYGGTKLPEYWDGGRSGLNLSSSTPQQDMNNYYNTVGADQLTSQYEQKYNNALNNRGSQPSFSNTSYQQFDPSTSSMFKPYVGGAEQNFKGQAYSSPTGTYNKQGKLVAGPEGVPLGSNDKYKPTGIDYAMMASNLIGPAYTLATNKKPKPFSYNLPDYQKYDPTAELNEADRQNRIAQGLTKNFAAGNSAAYLATMPMLQANMMTNKQGVLNRAQNINTQYYNQLQPTIAQIKNQNIDAMQKDLARYQDINQNAVNTLGKNVSSSMKDYKSGKMDNMSANLIDSMFTSYKLDKSNPDHWKWIYDKIGK